MCYYRLQVQGPALTVRRPAKSPIRCAAGDPGVLEMQASSPAGFSSRPNCQSHPPQFELSFPPPSSPHSSSRIDSRIQQPTGLTHTRNGFATLGGSALQEHLPSCFTSNYVTPDRQPKTTSGHTRPSRHTGCHWVQGANCHGLPKYGRTIHHRRSWRLSQPALCAFSATCSERPGIC